MEYHVFLDHDDASSLTHIERCRAALVAIEGRLAPRLKAAAWHREQFALWLWDPVIPESRRGCTAWAAGDASKSSAEPHLWGRVCVGESVDDEWFIVGLLLQLTAEQPDASVTVADEDGELLLIEAAHAIPRWLTPERATNRVFLRRGALHIVPRATRAKKVSSGGGAAAGSAAERDSLPLTDALDALRTQSLGITRHAAATELIRARTDPLLGADCTRRGPQPRRALLAAAASGPHAAAGALPCGGGGRGLLRARRRGNAPRCAHAALRASHSRRYRRFLCQPLALHLRSAARGSLRRARGRWIRDTARVAPVAQARSARRVSPSEWSSSSSTAQLVAVAQPPLPPPRRPPPPQRPPPHLP